MVIKIAFGGKMGSGKTTIIKYLINKYGGYGLNFSDALYDILYYSQERCGIIKQKDRKFLQWVGTEWGKNINPNLWINITLTECNKLEYENIYIGDVRYYDELKAVKENNFITIRIDRNINNIDKNRCGTGSISHSSETELDKIDNSEWNYIIKNDETIDVLYKSVDNIINELIINYL